MGSKEHHALMFVVECPRCGQRELRSIHAINGLSNTVLGIELALTCSNCGTDVRLITGRQAAGSPVTLAARPTGARPTGPADRPAA
jgi:DNA-directed RNA polymerase subunit RPC12/RpoP